MNLCACGCGQEVKRNKARFLSNHWWKLPEYKNITAESNTRRAKQIPYIAPCINRRFKGGQYYSRYIMEQHLGRALLTNEHVHHLDGDQTNDSLENLVVLTKSQHVKTHNKHIPFLRLTCPNCGKKFERKANCNKKSKNRFCSKECFYAASLIRKVTKKQYNKIMHERWKAKRCVEQGGKDGQVL